MATGTRLLRILKFTLNNWPSARTSAPGMTTPEMRPPHIQVPIRTKITLPYILLAAFVATAAAFVITQLVFDTAHERFVNQLIETGKIASESMVREEDRLLSTLRLLAYTNGLAEAVRAGESDRVRELAYPIALNGLEEAVEILDAQGNLVLSMHHRTGGNIEDYDFSGFEADALAHWPIVQQVIERQTDGLGDKYTGSVQVAGENYLYVSGPIYDSQGNFAGAVLVGKSLSGLVQQIREETLSHLTIYTFEGQPISTTLIQAQALDRAQAFSVLQDQDRGSYQRQLNIGNIEYLELLGPWEVRGDHDLGVMGFALPQTFLISTTLPTRIQILVVVALALFLITVIGFYVAQRITKPLLQVVQASAQVAEGNLEVRVDLSSNDEVALLAHSFNHMIASLQRSKQELLQTYDTTLAGWSKALELRDQETEGHSQRVTKMTVTLARAMEVSEADVIHIRRGAMLHDIGKMGIPDSILLKPGPLTDQEREMMHRHPEYAYQLLSQIAFLQPALDIPYCHHERWDGTGYPRGLKGESIPLSARIFAVVDVWDALGSDRPYRPALPPAEIREHISAGAGTHFDPGVVVAFLKLISHWKSDAASQATKLSDCLAPADTAPRVATIPPTSSSGLLGVPASKLRRILADHR
jgi:putative nucleotidyltransferase with HDIG domain